MAEQKMLVFDSLSTLKEVLRTFHYNICCCTPEYFWLFLFCIFHNWSWFSWGQRKVVVSCQLHTFGTNRVCQCWLFGLGYVGNTICRSGFEAGQESSAWCVTVIQTFLVKWDSENISYWFAFVLVLGEREVQTIVQLLAVETYSLGHVLANGQPLEKSGVYECLRT